jgi:transposase
MDIKTLGIDIGKNKFHVYGVNEHGKQMIRREFSRRKLYEYMANLKPCLVGMEACGGAHHLARMFTSYGHDVRLMAIQHVKPYTSAYKNDLNDAAGICEAVTRPRMNFVAIKTVQQQEIIAIHNNRQRLIAERTVLANEMRAFLLEQGITIDQGISKIIPKVNELLDLEAQELTPLLKNILRSILEEFQNKFTLVAERDKQLKEVAKSDTQAKKLMEIPGFGLINATAFVAKIGDVNTFKNGRQLSAWAGMVPNQNSTGGKNCLGSISKRGDRYLRCNLIHGARSVLTAIKDKPKEELSSLMQWFKDVAERRGNNKAIVAFANKMGRIGWALLAHDTCFDANYKKGVLKMTAA